MHPSAYQKFRSVRSQLKLWLEQKFGNYANPEVIVLPEYQILYVPVPKVACSSIKSALAELREGPVPVKDPHRYWGYHTRLSHVRRLVDDRWLVFTVVRNPYYRVTSAWRNRVRDGYELKRLQFIGITKGDSFDRFLTILASVPGRELEQHTIPQALRLNKAMRLPQMKVYRFEELDTAWAEISDEIFERTGRRLHLPHINRTTKEETKISKDQADLIRRIYDLDFEVFGYVRSLDTT